MTQPDWSALQLRDTLSRKKRATLAAFRLLERYSTLHSGNCQSPTAYRRTLLKRLAVVLPLTNSTVRIVDGYLT